MQFNTRVREEFDDYWTVEVDDDQRISVPHIDTGLEGVPGIYLWLRLNRDATHIMDGYVGESGNLIGRIDDYLTPNPRGTAKRISQEMRSWKAQYPDRKIQLAVVCGLDAAQFQFDGEETWHYWQPSVVAHRRVVESTHIWIGRKRGYTLLNVDTPF